MASRRLFYFIEKYGVKAQNNPMWKNYIKENKELLDSNPKIANDLALLFKSTEEYKKLLETYNIGVHRDSKKSIESIANRVGLRLNKIS